MVYDKFSEISKAYPDIIIDKLIVMPNHIHAIIILDNIGTTQSV
ncbi:MAG: hypothetical protein K0R84_1165 [Clostridia bacterium]|nr:hypothetical protein [Clostridia bacterium]